MIRHVIDYFYLVTCQEDREDRDDGRGHNQRWICFCLRGIWQNDKKQGLARICQNSTNIGILLEHASSFLITLGDLHDAGCLCMTRQVSTLQLSWPPATKLEVSWLVCSRLCCCCSVPPCWQLGVVIVVRAGEPRLLLSHSHQVRRGERVSKTPSDFRSWHMNRK